MSELPDYDTFTSRLLKLVAPGRLAASFAIGHLITQMQNLDIAVEDYDVASAEYQRAAARWGAFVDRLNEDGYADPAKEAESTAAYMRELAPYASTGHLLNYRADSAYGVARRVLDRVVAVANELLPRTGTDLGTSHAKFKARLARRCTDLGIDAPEDLLKQTDDLNDRIKTVRDRLTEHLASPMDMRSISVSSNKPYPRLSASRVVRVDPGAVPDRMTVEFEPAGELREAIHVYIAGLLELLEAAPAMRSSSE